MIKSFIVTNPKGESLVLELKKPEKSGLIVQSVTGLGPPKANINSIDLATTDGALYSSARAQTRNIVFNLLMMESPTIEDARQRTYKYFPLKKLVRIRVETDNLTADAFGYVESNEPNIFSRTEGCQISVLCLDPFFYDTEESRVDFSSITPLFEFPFSNESVTEDLIEFGQINLDTRAELNYNGDIDTGVLISIHALGPVKNITLYNVETKESIAINTDKIESLIGRAFASGDDIIISTISGKKYVNVVHDGITTNAISCINKDADWFQLSVGKNIFNFAAEEGLYQVSVAFSYKNAYGGI